MAPKLNTEITIQDVGDESLILDLNSGQIHQLNATAAWILTQCDGINSVDAICEHFARSFSIDRETADRDVHSVLAQLKELDIISE